MSETITFSRHEAALRLGVSIITVDRALAKNEITHFRVGRRILFSDSHLQNFLAKCERKAKTA